MNGKHLTVEKINGMAEALGAGEAIVIYELPQSVYRKVDAISNSDMGYIKESPAQLIWARNAPVDVDKLKALDFGSAVHCQLLEPEKFSDEYAVAPEVNRATKAGKEEFAAFELSAGDKCVLSADEHKKLDFMTRSALAHPTYGQLLSGGYSEVSIIWRDADTGLLCKCRPDKLIKFGNQWFCLDVKTTDSIETFFKSIGDYDYHRQQAFYEDGLAAAGMPVVFLFGPISKTISLGRYPVAVRSIERDDVDAGRIQYKALLRRWAECKRTGQYDGITMMGRSYYARRDDEFLKENQNDNATFSN